VPCIALIEDIDNVFHGRENVTRKNGLMPIVLSSKKENDNESSSRPPFTPLTFDCLLNCLDGVERSDGIFTIITTNDISKVDPALGQPRRLPDGTTEFISTRPGRIDKAVELTYMEPGDKKRMARRILGDYPEKVAAMLEFIDRYPDLDETPAQFQERCGQIALACFWTEKHAAIVPPDTTAERTAAVDPEADRDSSVTSGFRIHGAPLNGTTSHNR
jgi:SpoVK/Ycf46/Vps4 family AAA+-type ATPase